MGRLGRMRDSGPGKAAECSELTELLGPWKTMLRVEQMMESWLVKFQEEAKTTGAGHVIF